MFFRVATTPAVVAAPAKPLTGKTQASTPTGLGQYLAPGVRRLAVPRLYVVGGRGRGLRGLRGLGQAAISQSTPNLPSGCSPLPGSGSLCATALYGSIPCNEVRECDPVTGAVHYQYTLPTTNPDTPNADILTVSSATGDVLEYNDATGGISPTSPVTVGTQIEQGGITTYSYPTAVTPKAPVTPAAPASSSSGGSGGSSSAAGTTPAGGAAAGASSTVPPPYVPPAYTNVYTGAINTTPAAVSAGGISLPASFSFLENTVSLFGYSVPVWALGLAGVGLVWFLSERGK
jgi:hypothetical protein